MDVKLFAINYQGLTIIGQRNKVLESDNFYAIDKPRAVRAGVIPGTEEGRMGLAKLPGKPNVANFPKKDTPYWDIEDDDLVRLWMKSTTTLVTADAKATEAVNRTKR